MKVSTIACLFGALIEHKNPVNILDIGAGTGLLSLMMAQKFNEAIIDSIEIESGAFHQAKQNYRVSKWKERLKIIHGDFLAYDFSTRYDLIISNPPFYKSHIKGVEDANILARHRDHFSFEKFIVKVKPLLKSSGRFWVILPEFEMKLLEKLAAVHSLNLYSRIEILNFEGARPIAVVSCFTLEKEEYNEGSVIIRKDKNKYSDEFLELLGNYYL